MATIWQRLASRRKRHRNEPLTEIPDDQITGSLRAVLGLVALKYSRLQLERAAADRLTELLHRGEADPEVRHLVQVVQRSTQT